MTLSGNYPRQRQGIARLSLVVLLYSIWMFVYFLCFQTPPKHGEIWHADAWQPCPGLLSVFVSIGVVVTKNDIFKQKYLNVNKHFAALTAWQACAINSITINSSGYVLGQSSYSHPTGSNSLSHIISFYGLCLWSVYVFVCRVTPKNISMDFMTLGVLIDIATWYSLLEAINFWASQAAGQ